MEIIWKPQAEKDLVAIEEYYLTLLPDFAEIIIREILTRTGMLGQFPQSGRKVPEIIYRNYRIIYHYTPEDNRIGILTLFHSSRQFGS
jgi:toxin ParE1/3/4